MNKDIVMFICYNKLSIQGTVELSESKLQNCREEQETKMANDTQVKVKIAPDMLYQELDDEAVILNLANEQYYGLNDVGRHMWQLLSEHGNVESVVAQLKNYYDADEATLRSDLMTLIKQLQADGLITVQPDVA